MNNGVNVAYPYTVTATDPQSDAITYSISSQSNMSNLSINSTTGVVSWSPTTAEVGTQSITVTATDTLGLQAVQTFNVNVVNSQPPTITGTPPSMLTAGLTFVYQVQASDPAGDALSYSLIGATTGMAIDTDGRIILPTTAANVGDYSYQVMVTNPYGLSVTSPSYSLDVTRDTTLPSVVVEISTDPGVPDPTATADVNSTVYFDVIASDNVGMTSIGLTVGGTPVVLSTNGQGVYTASTLGQLSVVATASDAAGNTGMADATLSVIDPTDTSAPVVSIASPGNSVVITSPTEVVGTVSDSHILSWTLAEAPLNGGTFTTIATGTSTVNDAGLGLFDPTTLADGAYTIELTAWNAGGHVSTTSITVNVTGYLKLGNLSLSFTDLSIPVAGIPITITRTYNSLNANTVGDFGYGWTLSETDYQLSVNTLGNGLGSFSDYVPLEGGNRVVVTLPDGTEEGFTFEPQPVYAGDGLLPIVEYYQPYFVPDPGVTDTLTVQPVDLSLIPGTNEYYGGDDDDDYNPAQSEFGGDYTLTNESGISTTFDADDRPGHQRSRSPWQHADVRFHRHLFQHRPGRHIHPRQPGPDHRDHRPGRRSHLLWLRRGRRPRLRHRPRQQRHDDGVSRRPAALPDHDHRRHGQRGAQRPVRLQRPDHPDHQRHRPERFSELQPGQSQRIRDRPGQHESHDQHLQQRGPAHEVGRCQWQRDRLHVQLKQLPDVRDPGCRR